MSRQEEMRVEQVRMERYIQPSGVEVKLRLLEVPKGLVGHPYTLEREVSGKGQYIIFSMTYGRACAEFNKHRRFERCIGSLLTLLGDVEIDQ